MVDGLFSFLGAMAILCTLAHFFLPKHRAPSQWRVEIGETVYDRLGTLGLRSLYAAETIQNLVFGKRLFSFRAFFVQFLITTTIILIFIAIYYFDSNEIGLIADQVDNFGYFFVIFVIGNYFLDFFSNMQTRLFTRKALKAGFFKKILYVVLDYNVSNLLSPFCVFLLVALFLQEHEIMTFSEEEFRVSFTTIVLVFLIGSVASPVFVVLIFLDLFGVWSFRGGEERDLVYVTEAIFLGCIVSNFTTSALLWFQMIGELLFRLLLFSGACARYIYRVAGQYDSQAAAPIFALLAAVTVCGTAFHLYKLISGFMA